MDKIKRVLFIGSKRLGLRCLKMMTEVDKKSIVGVMTFDDRMDARSVYQDFQNYALLQKIPLYVVENKLHSEELIRKIKPELCIVIGWYWLIGNQTLKCVKQGFIGLHNSLLPEYRGSSPLVWAIINNEKIIGMTLFSFTEGMDDGPIWSQISMRLKTSNYISDVLDKLELKAEKMIKNIYPKLLIHKIKPVLQDHAQATYCAARLPEDSLIDWNWDAEKIYNFIRAQSAPYPGAYTCFKEEKLIIWRASLEKEQKVFYGTPGQVVNISSKGVGIACGDQRLIFLESVQFTNKNTLANKVIKSLKVRFPRNSMIADF